jgi:hypothetical protein
MNTIKRELCRRRTLLAPVIIITFAFFATPDLARGQQSTVKSDKSPLPIWNYVPMTGQERWHDYVRQNFAQPGAFFQTFFTALGDQTGNVPSDWGGGANKFPQRLASEFARFTIGGTIASTIDAGLQQDTRFFRCTCRGAMARTVHAVSRTFLTYNRDGKRRLDIGGIAGIYGGPMVMTTWYPSRYTALGYGIRQGNMAAGITTGIYVIREFSPELRRLFRHRDKTSQRTR